MNKVLNIDVFCSFLLLYFNIILQIKILKTNITFVLILIKKISIYLKSDTNNVIEFNDKIERENSEKTKVDLLKPNERLKL